MEQQLGKKVKVVMDRPLGCKHPEYDFFYPINYGYIPDTMAADGEEIDAYIVGEYEPLSTYEGYIIAVIRRNDDVEEKMVVCKEKGKFTKAQIEALVNFQERFFDSTVIMEEEKEKKPVTVPDTNKVVEGVGSILFAIITLIAIIRGEHPYGLIAVYSITSAVKTYYGYKEKNSKLKRAEWISFLIIAVCSTFLYVLDLFGV